MGLLKLIVYDGIKSMRMKSIALAKEEAKTDRELAKTHMKELATNDSVQKVADQLKQMQKDIDISKQIDKLTQAVQNHSELIKEMAKILGQMTGHGG